MIPNDLILISTCRRLDTPEATNKLLQESVKLGACGHLFGNDCYPILGFDASGNIHWVCDENSLIADFIIIVIPDQSEIEKHTLDYIKKKLKTINKLFVLLHSGKSSVYKKHQEQLIEASAKHLKKVHFYEGYHSQKSILGEGLEMIVLAAGDDNIKIERMEIAVTYLKSRPEYYNIIKEEAIRLYSLIESLLQKKKILKWGETDFMNALRESNVEQIAARLGSAPSLPQIPQLTIYQKRLEAFINSF